MQSDVAFTAILSKTETNACYILNKRIIFILRQSFTVSPNTLLCVNENTDSYN